MSTTKQPRRCQYLNLVGRQCPRLAHSVQFPCCRDHSCLVDECHQPALPDASHLCQEHRRIHVGRCEYLDRAGRTCARTIFGDLRYCEEHTFGCCQYRDPVTAYRCLNSVLASEALYCDEHGCHYFDSASGYCPTLVTNQELHACDEHQMRCQYVDESNHVCGRLFLKTEHRVDEHYYSVGYVTCPAHRCAEFNDDQPELSHRCNEVPLPSDSQCCARHAEWKEFQLGEPRWGNPGGGTLGSPIAPSFN
jgi:hypothetical protein